MVATKYELMSAEETAEILGITLNRLYKICNIFDKRDDDEWELNEGEHFEWLSKGVGTRRFYESGAMAIAKYIQEKDTASPIAHFVDMVIERITHRRERTRRLLVRRRIILETKDNTGVLLASHPKYGDLVFLERSKVIRILETNGKGLNAAAKREQDNPGLGGREPMEKGVHFDSKDDVQYWSQLGMVHIAKNMSENMEKRAKKSRKAWTDAVAEVVEDAIAQQMKYLESFDARVTRAMDRARAAANKKCQVTLKRQTPASPFDLHVHHLFDRSTRPDLADFYDNLLVIHEDLHKDFHKWHGKGACEPKHLVEYLTTIEAWRFEKPKMTSHLHHLINKLEHLQSKFESHHHLP
jgi:hypothetical protein